MKPTAVRPERFDLAQDRPFDLAQDRHCRDTPDTRAAQQLQQQRFRLVVGMMRQCNEIALLPGESSMAQLARSGFDTVIGLQRGDVDAFDMQRDVEPNAKSGAEVRPSIGIGTDPVMDMQCGKLPLEAGSKGVQQVQQHDGIHAAAQTDEDLTVSGKQRRQARRDGVS